MTLTVSLMAGLGIGLLVGLILIGNKIEEMEAKLDRILRILDAREPPYED